MDFLSYDLIITLITLTFIEIVLGIDNLIFIAIAVQNLPKNKRKTARIFGLSLALIIRVIMLFALSWVMTLTKPFFSVGNFDFSFKDLLLFSGGLFLIIKSGYEISKELKPSIESSSKETKTVKKDVQKTMTMAIIQIIVVDLVFSFDSVITAVGMTSNIPVIVTAIVISMIIMLMASESLSAFLHQYPSLKIIALAFIFMIGVILTADGIHLHIPKGYLYFSLFFTSVVEIINIIVERRIKKKLNQY
jgi:predicted tellurium resistance membrane protein TerC